MQKTSNKQTNSQLLENASIHSFMYHVSNMLVMEIKGQ